jgi:hypothetical protein
VKEKQATISRPGVHGYSAVLADIVQLIETARSAAARSANAIMTATYWAIGRSIVEEEQRGSARAGYGEEIVVGLSRDLQARFGRGLGRANSLATIPLCTLSRRHLDNPARLLGSRPWRRTSSCPGRTTYACSRHPVLRRRLRCTDQLFPRRSGIVGKWRN